MSFFVWAQIISVISIICTSIGVFQKEKWKCMLFCSLTNIILIAVYLLLGRILGAILVAGALVRTITYFVYAKLNKNVPSLLFVFFELYLIAFSIFMFKDFSDIFIIINLVLVTYSTWQNNMKVLRLGYLLSSLLLITYNSLVGAYIEIASEFILLCSYIIAIYKFDIKSKVSDIVLDFYDTISPTYEISTQKEHEVFFIKSKVIDDSFNNFAYLPCPKDFESQKETLKNKLQNENMPQNVYFQSIKNNEIHYIYEQIRNYKLLYNDVWMQLVPGLNLESRKPMLENLKFRKCSEKDKKDILHVFDKGFVHIGTNNVYKYSESYLNNYKVKLSDQYFKEQKITPYMAFYEGKAISLLFFYRKNYNAYLCQVTTLEKYRKKGVATALIKYAVAQERRNGIENFYLVTEKNSYLELFYIKNNFCEISQGFCIDISKKRKSKARKKQENTQ